MLLNRTLRLFLDSIGRREEYEFYLEKFQAFETLCFAVVCPEAEAFEQSADVLVFDLQFLLRLELEPLLLLAGPESPAMRHALRDYHQEVDIRAMEDFVRPSEGVGPCRKALEKFIDDAVQAGRIPALATLQPVVPAAAALIPEVAKRIHLVRVRGPLHDERHQVVPFYYLMKPSPLQLEPEDADALDVGLRLLAQCGSAHVSITSPIHLLKEMFTVRGAGTVLRRGSVIRHLTRIEDVDRARLEALLVESFGRPLAHSQVFAAVRHYFIEEDYRAAALLEEHAAGAYLSKFAVGTEARGEGVAQELWREMAQGRPALYWRARDDNPINQWYERLADGRQHLPGWVVFWRGMKPDHLPDIIEYCRTRPPDFVETRSS